MRRAVALVVLLAAAFPTRAATFSIGAFSAGTPIIDVAGPISDGDDRKFALFANSIPSAVVRFDSPGGQLWASLNIGETIARKGYATFVGPGRLCGNYPGGRLGCVARSGGA